LVPTISSNFSHRRIIAYPHVVFSLGFSYYPGRIFVPTHGYDIWSGRCNKRRKMSRKKTSKYSRIGIPVTELVGSLRLAVSFKRSVDLKSLCVGVF